MTSTRPRVPARPRRYSGRGVAIALSVIVLGMATAFSIIHQINTRDPSPPPAVVSGEH